jgi:hypothetical protein
VFVANIFTQLFLGYQPYQLWSNAQYFRGPGPVSQSNWGDKWLVALNPVAQYLLLDLFPVTFSMTSVTSQVVETRRGKMVTAKKLAVLQNLNRRKVFLLGYVLDDLTQQNKVRSGRKWPSLLSHWDWLYRYFHDTVTLFATSAKRCYTVTSDCDRKMF